MKTEINGFEIDIYNQYNLDEGKKYQICPGCSSTRKKKKEKCASADWNRGLLTCHHCGEVFQLHTYTKQKKIKSFYAYNDNEDGTTTYYHDDGTTTIK